MEIVKWFKINEVILVWSGHKSEGVNPVNTKNATDITMLQLQYNTLMLPHVLHLQ